MAGNPGRELALRGLLLLAGLLAPLLAFEGALRVYHGIKQTREESSLPPLEQRALVPSEDPELIFEFNPGWKSQGFSINSQGMPDAERQLEPPPGTLRVALVGDSISANVDLTPRQSIFPTLLPALLEDEASGLRVEVLNFGVQGYGINQLLRMARTRVPRFHPDLLLVQLCLNDPYPTDTVYHRPNRGPTLRTWNLVFRVLRPDRFWAHNLVGRNYDRRGWANVRTAFEGFAELRDGGLPVLLVLFPYLYAPAYQRWGFGPLHQGYRSEAERLGLAYLDLYSSFSEGGFIDDRWPKDPLHPDAAGHRLAAERIAAEILGRGFLEGAHVP